MVSRNPALNDDVFQKEIRASGQGGGFSPAWGSPADELPPGVFGPGGAAPAGGPVTQPGGPLGGGPVVSGGGGDDTMRLGGTLSATGILLALLVVAGWFGWQAVIVTEVTSELRQTVTRTAEIQPWIFGAVIVGFLLAIVTVFKPKLARITAPLYAVAEGLFVGAISHYYEAQFEGIVLQAVGLTVGVFVVLLVLFASGAVRVTERMRTMVFAATGAIALVYLATMVLRLFGSDVPFIHGSGAIGIGFSVLVVGIASFNLLLDFDFIQRGVTMRAPRYMEWFAAFGLMVSLVWLYLELLRLLSKLRSR